MKSTLYFLLGAFFVIGWNSIWAMDASLATHVAHTNWLVILTLVWCVLIHLAHRPRKIE